DPRPSDREIAVLDGVIEHSPAVRIRAAPVYPEPKWANDRRKRAHGRDWWGDVRRQVFDEKCRRSTHDKVVGIPRLIEVASVGRGREWHRVARRWCQRLTRSVLLDQGDTRR